MRLYQIQYRPIVEKDATQPIWEALISFPMEIANAAKLIPILEEVVGPDYALRVTDVDNDAA